MSEISSNFVDVDGIRTHYLACGDEARPAVVLIHGGGAGASSRGNWSHLLPVFGANYRTLAVDMVGFGDTDKPDPGGYTYSQGNRVAHLAGFVEALGIAPAPLIGNSMGGATALGVAMHKPELVSALVLMGSAGLNTDISPALRPILNYDFTVDGMRRLVDGLTGSRYQADEAIIHSRHEDSLRPETKTAYGNIMGWIGQQGGLFYPEEDIARVKTETLVVNGKEDLVVPLSCAYKFLELLENSRGYLIPHVGHWVMLEAPDEFAEVVNRFLGRALGEAS
jgi:2-hydroxy-6-oxo-6-(2'-aminophenyl)hexa-2,4-dienoate hydrolase